MPLLIPLIARLALIATPALTGLFAVLLVAFLRAASLRDFALQLIGESIELRLRELQLLRVVTEDAFRRPFDAASQFIDFVSRRLSGLPRLR